MKKISIIFLVLLIPAVTFAISIDELVAKAENQSPLTQQYKLTYQDSQILAEQADLTSGLSVSADLYGIEIDKDDVTQPKFNIGLSYGSANDKGKVSFSFMNVNSARTLTEDYYTANFSAEKNIDLSKTEYSIDDLEDLKADLQSQYNYEKSMLSFDNNVIQSVVSIMETQNQITETKTKLTRAQETYQSDLEIGSINEGSLSDIKNQMEISSLETSLKSLENSLSTKLLSFETQFGFEYEKVTQVRDSSLVFTTDVENSSGVKLAAINLDIATADLEEAEGKEKSLDLSASYSQGIDTSDKAKLEDPDIGLGASYTLGNFTVSASANNLTEDTRSLTLSGSWSSTTTKNESDSLKIQQLTNTVLEKQYAYDDAVNTYNSDAESLKQEIESQNTDIEQNNIQLKYHKDVLSCTYNLYKEGLATQREVEDALSDVNSDLSNQTILKLKGIILENKIKLINL